MLARSVVPTVGHLLSSLARVELHGALAKRRDDLVHSEENSLARVKRRPSDAVRLGVNPLSSLRDSVSALQVRC